MKTAIAFTVRLKSKRLPKKALLKLEGKTMIEHMIERIKRAKNPDMVIMCTSTNPQDDELISIAQKTGIKYFRGSEDDVIERLYSAAKENKVDFLVVCMGDNPLTDPVYIDKIIDKFKDTDADYITCLDLLWGTFSYGLKTSAMKKVVEMKKESDTEVWGQYFAKSNLFKTEKIDVEKELVDPSIRLTVDTPKDFELMKKIYQALYPKNKAFTLKEVVKFLNEHPEIKKINKDVKQEVPKQIDSKALVDASKETHITAGTIKDYFNQMNAEKNLSYVFKDKPKILFINLPPGFKGEEEVHEDDDDLYIVIEGSAEVVTDGRTLTIKKGDLLHIPAKQVHKLSYTKNGVKYIVVKIARK